MTADAVTFSAPLPDGARLLVLTGLLSKDEARVGVFSSTRSRRKLLQMLKRVGVDAETVAFAPVLPYSIKGDILRHDDLTAARTYVADIVKRVQPRVVVALGSAPVQVLAGDDWPIGLHRGDLNESEFVPCKFIASYAPGYCLPKGKWQEQRGMERDLQKAALYANADREPLALGENYSVILTLDDARAARDYILSRPSMSFDFETEGFALWNDDEILTLQIATAPGEGFVFPLRGAWKRHETDFYPDWQMQRGEFSFVEQDGHPRRVLRDLTEKHHIIKPAFRGPDGDRLGDVVCQTPERHDRESGHWEKGHICRGYLTDVLSGAPVRYPGPGRQHDIIVPHDYIAMVDIIREILESDVPKIAQNGKFDVHAARYRWDIRVRNFTFDTILAHHLVQEEKPHDLETLRAHYTWVPRYNLELKSYVPSKRHSFALVPNEILWLYGAADADCEFRLKRPLSAALCKDNPDDGPWLLENVAMPLQRTLTQIEETGILIDRARLNELSEMYRQKIAELTRRLNVLAEAHQLSVLDKWTDRASLSAFLFNKRYELVITKAKHRTCVSCRGDGKARRRDHRGILERDADGNTIATNDACLKCNGAGAFDVPAVTRPMRGLGVPRWLAVKTKKGGDGPDATESTGKKTRKAIIGWCNETHVIDFVVDSKGNGEARRTKKLLSDRERTRRAWMRDIIETIDKLKVATQAKNLFLDGNDDKQVLGAKALLRYIRHDGRVHPSFNQLIETGRLSATEPNTQNISGNPEDRDYSDEFEGMGIRSMFTVPPGQQWSAYDYSSEEVRIMAYLSGDRDLQAALMSCETCGENFEPTQAEPDRPFRLKSHFALTGHEPVDIHVFVASRVYHKPKAEITKGERTGVKRVTYGLAYGQGPKGLAEVLGISMSEAKELITFYMKEFPKLEKYQSGIFALTEKGKRVPSATGRLRHNYNLTTMRGFVSDRDYRAVLNAKYRERVNFTIQSPAADFLSIDTIGLADVWGIIDNERSYAHELVKDILGFDAAPALRDLGCLCINSMHDALDWQNPPDYAGALDDIVLTVMEQVPWHMVGWYLPVDGSHGRYWEDTEATPSRLPDLQAAAATR